MTCRSLIHFLTRGAGPVFGVRTSTPEGLRSSLHRHRRTIHVATRSMAAKMFSVDEMFANKSLQDYLTNVQKQYNKMNRDRTSEEHNSENDLRDQKIRMSRLAPVIHVVQELELKEKEMKETEMLLNDEEPAMRELAELERESCLQDIQSLRQTLINLLVPEEEVDQSDLVLEVTAGVGGQEAMLFTAELFDMYESFAEHHGWTFDLLDQMKSDLGGIRRASASISGPGSYKKMKFEGGVHRVQRIPKTEKTGRIHTSTMTVAVLPQPREIIFTINPKDLKIETTKAGGPGGQHVNTTDSAVRIVHLPTGVAVECKQERSQIKNKEKAMQTLRAKLYGMKLEEETSKRNNQRKVQTGTRGRSEKIRTYNFPQDRITDHRIGLSVHDVGQFLQGQDLLDQMNSALQEFSDQEALMELLEENSKVAQT